MYWLVCVRPQLWLCTRVSRTFQLGMFYLCGVQVQVKDRNVIETMNAETRVKTPAALQSRIDESVGKPHPVYVTSNGL